MEIVIGNSQKSTTIDTEERTVVIAPDKGDKLVVVLGINRVEIEFVEGSWTISHNVNVVTRTVSRSDPKAFSPEGEKLRDILA